MVFVFDLDDTICDTDGYSEFYISTFFKLNNMPYKQIANDARYAEMKFDWDHETAINWYKTYGDDMMAEFPCKKNAVKILNMLYNMGHTIVIATARESNWHANPEEVTKQWLKENNIKYHKLYVGRNDKEQICEEVNADVFVDDDINITSRVARHNSDIQVFLANTNYNRHLPTPAQVVRVKTLKQMVDQVLDCSFEI